MSYYITTDATCDFPKELLNFENFEIIPMTYTIGDTEYGIDKQLSGKEFYNAIRDGAMPTTSLITCYTATEFSDQFCKQAMIFYTFVFLLA